MVMKKRRDRSSVGISNSISNAESIFFQAEDGIRDVAVTGVQTCSSDLFNDSSAPRGRSTVSCLCASSISACVGSCGGKSFDWNSRTMNRRRSEERRVGKECRSRWLPDHLKKKGRIGRRGNGNEEKKR